MEEKYTFCLEKDQGQWCYIVEQATSFVCFDIHFSYLGSKGRIVSHLQRSVSKIEVLYRY